MAGEPLTAIMEDHFLAPRNSGALESADAVGQARHGECGDWLVIYLALESDTIRAATFKAYGCAAAIAAGSMTTCLLVGRTLAEARAVDDDAVSRALGGFPAERRHCSLLAAAAIADAMADLARRRGAAS